MSTDISVGVFDEEADLLEDTVVFCFILELLSEGAGRMIPVFLYERSVETFRPVEGLIKGQ